MPQVFVEFFKNLLYFDSPGVYRGENFFCESLRFERDNKESGVIQHDEVWLCEGIDLLVKIWQPRMT